MLKAYNTKYGMLTFDESFWTGKKRIVLDGIECKKNGRNKFVFCKDGKIVNISINGNPFKGLTITVGEESFVLEEPSKWYEIVIVIFTFAFGIIWGNAPSLVMILPLVGGAIGGGITGLMACLSSIFMKKVKKPGLKVLTGLGFFVANVQILYIIAVVIITMAQS